VTADAIYLQGTDNTNTNPTAAATASQTVTEHPDNTNPSRTKPSAPKFAVAKKRIVTTCTEELDTTCEQEGEQLYVCHDEHV